MNVTSNINTDTRRGMFLAILLVCSLLAAVAGNYTLTVKGDQILLNGQTIKLIGLRCSNALISDATTQQLIDNLDVFKGYGVNSCSVYVMGSRYGTVQGFKPDSTLDPVYSDRLGKIIEAADKCGMVVLVGCLYFGGSKASSQLGKWQQAGANKAIANVVTWLKEHDYRNVFVDPDNEGMAHAAKKWDIGMEIDAGHAVDPTIMIANNAGGTPPDNADILIHVSKKVAGKPWVQTEGAAGWDYGSGNYNNIGIFTQKQQDSLIHSADNDITKSNGFMLASTWLQCVPPAGPNMIPGGDGSAATPGIKWWLEHILKTYGAWKPPALPAWVVTAVAGDNPGNVLNDSGVPWTTGRAMQPGDWLQIDLLKGYKLISVTLDSSQAPDEAAHGVQLLLSQDGTTFEKVVELSADDCAKLNGLVKFTLPAGAAARYLKFIQTGANGTSPWSITDVKVGIDEPNP